MLTPSPGSTSGTTLTLLSLQQLQHLVTWKINVKTLLTEENENAVALLKQALLL